MLLLLVSHMGKGLVFHGNTPRMRLYLVSHKICGIFLRIIIFEFKNSDPRVQEINREIAVKLWIFFTVNKKKNFKPVFVVVVVVVLVDVLVDAVLFFQEERLRKKQKSKVERDSNSLLVFVVDVVVVCSCSFAP